jgi:hypothetical protein
VPLESAHLHAVEGKVLQHCKEGHKRECSENFKHVLERNAEPQKQNKNKLRGFSRQANYTDRASDLRLSVKLVPTMRVEGC